MTDNETGNEDDPMLALVRQLFAPAEPDAQPAPPDPATANHVPGEGTNPTGEAHDMRTLVESLFFNHND